MFARFTMPAVVLLLASSACGPSSEVRQQLAQLEAISAEKDSLLLQVTENARLMSEISAEVARVKSPARMAAAEAPLEVTRENVLADIHALSERLNESEERLLASQQRVEALTRDNQRLSSSVREFQKAVLDFQATIGNQKATIASLTEEVNALREENVRLAGEKQTLTQTNTVLTEEKVALADTLEAVLDRNNTAYYVAGTKDELKRRGIIEEEGGSRVLFVFGKAGKTVVPARVLDPAQFTAIDMREVTEIALPWADRDYRIASRQDLAALASPPDDDGDLRGVLRIADPDRFWSGSRFLILVQK